MALQPLEDWMILDIVGDKSRPTSLVMPDGFEPEKDENAVFVIKAIGPGYNDNAGIFISCDTDMDLHKGDMVVITNYGMSKFKYKGEKVILARARDAVLKISEESKIKC